MARFKTLLFLFFTYFSLSAQNRYTISGFIREKGSQEQLIGVNIYVPNTSIGTSSNTYGFYSLTLPESKSLTLVFSYVGYQRVEKVLELNKNIELNITLEPTNELGEVVVSAKKQDERVSESSQMSKIELPINQIKKIPTLLGEKDVLKVLQLMPGVQKGSEGQSGIYVRGGGPDQNLIILDDAIVYNANHLFGFFSTFNGDALKSVELTKGGFPARFGGRLSSVIELNMKDGNKEKLHGEGGIGLISSRLTLEGPIKKNKSSFLISARRTYIDVLSKPFIKAAQKKENPNVDATGGYYFYDLNAKLNYELSKKDKLYLSGYFGNDSFYADVADASTSYQNGINWGNNTATLRWNHLFSQKLFSNASLIYSRYRFGIYSKNARTDADTDITSVYQLNYDSGIRDYTFKYDFDYFPSPKHAVKFGLQSIFHRFTPSATVLKDDNINLFENKVDDIDVVESGLYAEDVWSPIDKLKLNMGVRLAHYKTNNKYYLRPEPRIALALKLSNDLAWKASFAQMNQFVHLLSNTGLGLPTDLWVPTTDKLAPQNSKQFATGLAKDFDKQGFSVTLEGYYKQMNNIVNYKEGASFLVIDNPEAAEKVEWENNVTAGKGWSYGVEFLIQKKVGRFSGWIGYTWSKTQWQFAELNQGRVFFPKYDRRHDLSIVGIYELSKKITLSAVWVYGTGNALTIPLSEYTVYNDSSTPRNRFGDQTRLFWPSNRVNEYGERNSFRAEPYHRLDVAIQLHKKKKHHERTWEFGAYNLYNRKNPFFYVAGSSSDTGGIFGGGNQVLSADNQLVLKRYSLFPIIPSFSYNFKF